MKFHVAVPSETENALFPVQSPTTAVSTSRSRGDVTLQHRRWATELSSDVRALLKKETGKKKKVRAKPDEPN